LALIDHTWIVVLGVVTLSAL